MKIAMDSSLIHYYQEMLLIPLDFQSKDMRPNLRVPANEKEYMNIINALYKIKMSGARFCKLPINKEELEKFPQADKQLRECCIKNIDVLKINQRKNELYDSHEEAEDCKLLAEAEECGVNILLATNGSFKQNLEQKANNVSILHPVHDLNEIVK